MNKITTFLLASLFAGSATAQEEVEMRRGRIENVTDYSQPVVSRHHRVGSRATAPLPCMGSPKVPIILVQFDNLKFTADTLINKEIEHSDANVRALYEKFFNGNMDGTYYNEAKSQGAVRDYFATVSDSLFLPDFTVIGPVTLPRGFEYYGKDKLDQNGKPISKDINIDAFYNASCHMAVENFDVNWSDFDNNGDGKVDLVFFIYAGDGQNAKGVTTDAIWPKEGTSTLNVKLDDKTITFGAYGCTNEIYNNKLDGIGTCVHEVSHGLGLCDHYDYNSKLFGMDYWDVMDAGNYCSQGYQPCGYSAYEKDFMGWTPLNNMELNKQLTLTLKPMSLGGSGYKITNPEDKNDYYILENRQNKRYDGTLGLSSSGSSVLGYSATGKTHGLMVTHILYNSSSWSGNRVNTGHEYLTIIPADGEKISSMGGYTKQYLESMLGDLYPGRMNVNTFTLLGQEFEVIENEDLTITLKVNGGDPNSIVEVENAEELSEAQVFSLSGVAQPSLQRGVNIVRYKNGAVRKVLK